MAGATRGITPPSRHPKYSPSQFFAFVIILLSPSGKSLLPWGPIWGN